MPRPRKAWMLLLLFASLMLRWEGEQVWVWTQMIHERGAERSLAEAVESTLSGQEPCSRCVELTRERSESPSESFAAWRPLTPPVYLPPSDVYTTPVSPDACGYFLSFLHPRVSPPPAPELPPPISLQMI